MVFLPLSGLNIVALQKDYANTPHSHTHHSTFHCRTLPQHFSHIQYLSICTHPVGSPGPEPPSSTRVSSATPLTRCRTATDWTRCTVNCALSFHDADSVIVQLLCSRGHFPSPLLPQAQPAQTSFRVPTVQLVQRQLSVLTTFSFAIDRLPRTPLTCPCS